MLKTTTITQIPLHFLSLFLILCLLCIFLFWEPSIFLTTRIELSLPLFHIFPWTVSGLLTEQTASQLLPAKQYLRHTAAVKAWEWKQAAWKKDVNVISGLYKIPLFGEDQFPEKSSMEAICFSSLELWLMKYHWLASNKPLVISRSVLFFPFRKTRCGEGSFTSLSWLRLLI